MKLLSLYISAFGGVRDRAFTFLDGVSEICEPNGAGKSTLAAFIKAMLFGLSKEGNSLEKNEARLYEPWQGGRFGGSLTFFHEGRTYRIERYFERVGKVKLREEVRVIDEASGLATNVFGEDIGRALLGVDGPSFMKTAYLSSRGITAGKTDDISAKLGGIEGEEDDMAAFDRAVSLLKDKRREIRTQNNQKNGQKQLDLAERELERVRAEISVAERAGEALTRLSSELLTKKEDAARLDCTLSTLREEKSALDRRLGEREENERRLRELHARLEEQEEKERTLSAAFPSGVPAREVLDALTRDASEEERLAAERTAFRDTDALPALDDGAVAALRGALRKRDDLKTKLNSFSESEPHTAKNGGHTARFFLILSAVLAALAVAFFFILVPLAVGFLAACGLFAAGGGILATRARAERRSADERHAAIAEVRAAHKLAEEEAGDLLTRFGLLRDAGTDDVDKLREEALLLRIERERADRTEKAYAEIKQRIDRALALYPTLPSDGGSAHRVAALRRLVDELSAKRQSILTVKEEIVRLSEGIGRQGAVPREATERLDALLNEAEAARAALTAAIAEGGKEAEECRALAGALPALYDREAECLATVRELNERIGALDQTLEFLLSARTAYEEAYLGGIRGHITTYTDRLLAGKVGKAQLDLNLALSFMKEGEVHEAGYLSTGLLAISDVCLRLALTDSLYPKDPPPLILDDPFATLDEENLITALALLRELGKERQILYLTCHPSRCMGNQQNF